MPSKQSQPDIRAARLLALLCDTDIVKNDGAPNPKKLDLTDTQLGVSVFKNGHLYYDNGKEKRPKSYTSLTPDYSWGSGFIEVKDKISGSSWNSLNLHSRNDQIRASLLRARISGMHELCPLSFSQLSDGDQRIAEASLAAFPKSDPKDRLYIYWDTLVSAIASPTDNFIETVVSIGGKRLPLKKLDASATRVNIQYYLLDYAIMDKWDHLLGSIAQPP